MNVPVWRKSGESIMFEAVGVWRRSGKSRQTPPDPGLGRQKRRALHRLKVAGHQLKPFPSMRQTPILFTALRQTFLTAGGIRNAQRGAIPFQSYIKRHMRVFVAAEHVYLGEEAGAYGW